MIPSPEVAVVGPWRARWNSWYRRALPAYWIFLFTSTHFPGLRGVPLRPSDKLLHFAAFALLAFLFWRFVETFHDRLSRWFALEALLILGLYAATDEMTQGWVGRGVDLHDFFADFGGVAAMLAVLETIRRFRERHGGSESVIK